MNIEKHQIFYQVFYKNQEIIKPSILNIKFSNFKNIDKKYSEMLMALFDDVNNEQLGVDIKVIN